MTETSPLAALGRPARRVPARGRDRLPGEGRAHRPRGRGAGGRPTTATILAQRRRVGGGVRGPRARGSPPPTTRTTTPTGSTTAGCAPATSAALDAPRLHADPDRTKDVIKSGRRVDLLGRARERGDGPPRRLRGGGGRRARRPLGGAPARLRRPRPRARRSSAERAAWTFLVGRVARWWLPERWAFIDSRPQDLGRQVRQEGAAGRVRRTSWRSRRGRRSSGPHGLSRPRSDRRLGSTLADSSTRWPRSWPTWRSTACWTPPSPTTPTPRAAEATERRLTRAAARRREGGRRPGRRRRARLRRHARRRGRRRAGLSSAGALVQGVDQRRSRP